PGRGARMAASHIAHLYPINGSSRLALRASYPACCDAGALTTDFHLDKIRCGTLKSAMIRHGHLEDTGDLEPLRPGRDHTVRSSAGIRRGSLVQSGGFGSAR